jgi:hypothetical protein
LHGLSRHALMLSDVTASGLKALPTEWDLTLLIHQAELSAEVERVLSIGRRRLGLIPCGGRVRDFHCAVGTYTELGAICGSDALPRLEIPLVPALNGLPVLDETARQKIAEDFQPQLLAYRLDNFSKVLKAAFDAPQFTPSMQELAKSLAACTPGDPDLQAQVPEFLRFQDKEMRSAAWLELNTVIIEALLAFVHEAKADSIYVAEVAKAAEVILESRGEHQELEPRAIGPKLRTLGLNTEPRDREGIRLILTREVFRRVHELAYFYSVPSVHDGSMRCDFCREGRLKGGN